VVQYRGPGAFYQIGNVLVTNLSAVLADSLGGPVQRACVVPGEVVWDGCTCGLLAVSVRRWTLTDEFPDGSSGFIQSVTRSTPCDLPWLVGELHVEVVRCAPIPEGGALDVPCADLDAAAEVLVSDAYVTLTETVATLCELRETDQIVDYVLNDQDTRGPRGDCVGSELVAFVAIVR
jgi:hypothetical protein